MLLFYGCNLSHESKKWQALLETKTQERIALFMNVCKDDSVVVLDIPDISLYEVRTSATFRNDSLFFNIPSIDISFEGKLSSMVIDGIWRTSCCKNKVVFTLK